MITSVVFFLSRISCNDVANTEGVCFMSYLHLLLSQMPRLNYD